MRRIHVYLPESLAQRMDYFIKSEGFKGPSELVRFMIKYFEYLPPTPKRTNLIKFRLQAPFKTRAPDGATGGELDRERSDLFWFYPSIIPAPRERPHDGPRDRP